MAKGMPAVAASVALFLCCAVGWTPRALGAEGPQCVGVVLPLTGPAADQGKDILRGIEMARDAINRSAGSTGRRVVIAVEDDESVPKGAVSALMKLLQTKHPAAVVGPIASSNMLAMIPVALRERVVLLSPAASSPRITGAGPYIFRISLLAPGQAKALAEYSRGRLAATRAAILYSDDDTGAAYRDAFSRAFTARRGSIVEQESFDRAATDLRTQLAKIAAARPHVVFVAGVPQTVGLALRQAREMGLKMPFVGGYGSEGKNLLATAGSAAEGFTYTSIPISDAFRKSYRSRYHAESTIGAPLGYDALSIISKVASQTGGSAGALRNGLAKLRNYTGATGKTTFLATGDADKEVCLKVVRHGQFVRLTSGAGAKQ